MRGNLTTNAAAGISPTYTLDSRSVRRAVAGPNRCEELPPDLKITGESIVLTNALLYDFRVRLQGGGFGEALAEQLTRPIGFADIAPKRLQTPRVQFSKLIRVHCFFWKCLRAMPSRRGEFRPMDGFTKALPGASKQVGIR